jgi:excisionase family DNA binding protein
MTQFLTISEVAERYSVDPHSVLDWVRSGELRAVNVGRSPGRKKPRWRIPLAAVEQFELIRSFSPTPPRTRRRKRQPSEIIQYY